NIIFPTQIDRFIQKLNGQAVRITQKEKVLTQTIYREHIEKNPFEKLPSYHFEGLKKGIFCLKCNRSMKQSGKNLIQCLAHSHHELVDSAVLRSVLEFSILFAEKKITTTQIHEWCGGVVS